MVYIHGGSFYEGAAHHHPPNYLLEKDVVLVVPQYRLGPLGFLSTNSEDIPGNAGVLDVILALEWVQKHISHFGGSNISVTLFGQSAGAALVSSLLYSPNTPPDLFHRVILQSGSAMNNWAFDGNVEQNSREIAELAGCSILETVQSLNICFMNMDVKTMLTAFFTHAVSISTFTRCLMIFKIYVKAKQGANKHFFIWRLKTNLWSLEQYVSIATKRIIGESGI